MKVDGESYDGVGHGGADNQAGHRFGIVVLGHPLDASSGPLVVVVVAVVLVGFPAPLRIGATAAPLSPPPSAVGVGVPVSGVAARGPIGVGVAVVGGERATERRRLPLEVFNPFLDVVVGVVGDISGRPEGVVEVLAEGRL